MTALSAARVASIRSRSSILPAWKGEPLRLTTTSAPASAWACTGPDEYQMSSQMETPTGTPAIRKTGDSAPGRK